MKKINFDFYKNKKIFLGISVAVVLLGVVFTIIFGAKLDIQFAGGAVIKYSVDGDVNQEEIAEIVQETTGRSVAVNTNTLIGTAEQQVTLSFAGNQGLSLEEQQKIATVLSESYADRTFSVAESSSVDPTMGAKFFQKCLVCFGVAVLLLLVYIAIRFRKIGGTSAGVTAVLALVHDVLIVYFVFIVFRMNINDIFIAVILTIVGYSLNDTIVIYDRIRENNKLMGSKADLGEIMNLSLNQTLSRSINTSLATFLSLLVVYIVAAIYGLNSVTSFALPMMFGVVCGCYSSLFIATPLYTMWQQHKRNKASK
ncbi:MAG: protein translocase subunit SecF [Oscillospiraceae bacterium]